MSLRTKGLLVIALPLSMMFCAAGLFLLAQSSEADAQHWVQHTLEVKSQLEFVLRLVADSVATKRSYLLTSDEAFRAANQRARDTFPKALDRLAVLVSDNRAQSERLNQHLRPLIASYLASAAGMAPTKGGIAPTLEARLRQTDANVKQARAVASAIMDEEDRLLDLRQAQAESAKRLLAFEILITLVLSLVVPGGGMDFQRHHRRADRASGCKHGAARAGETATAVQVGRG